MSQTPVLTPDLLPPNASPLERELARLSERLDAIDPAPIGTLWDPWRVPAAMLTRLAWALSVDLWDDGWDEVTKRRAIAESPAAHRVKGSRASVDAALARLGLSYTLSEWFERDPPGRRGTLQLRAELPDEMAPGVLRRRIRAAIETVKPKARAMEIIVGARAPTRLGLRLATLVRSRVHLPVVFDPVAILPSPLMLRIGSHHRSRVHLMARPILAESWLASSAEAASDPNLISSGLFYRRQQ